MYKTTKFKISRMMNYHKKKYNKYKELRGLG